MSIPLHSGRIDRFESVDGTQLFTGLIGVDTLDVAVRSNGSGATQIFRMTPDDIDRFAIMLSRYLDYRRATVEDTEPEFSTEDYEPVNHFKQGEICYEAYAQRKKAAHTMTAQQAMETLEYFRVRNPSALQTGVRKVLEQVAAGGMA